MKGLNTLIKLAKRTLDELRRKMGALEGQKSQLIYVSVKLREELESEIELAKKQPEMGGFFGDFAKRIKKRQEDIASGIKKLDEQMAKLQTEISEAYGELKKYEIALDNAKRRAREEESRRETIQLDEIAGQQHRRRKEKQES